MNQHRGFIEEINNNRLKRHLLFLALTLITVFINGYHFGTFDQVFHIPFLKVWDNPSLYPNDPFVGLREYHFSYFWFMFLPAYRLGILEPVMFITHLAITYGTFWAFWDLCDLLFHNQLANVLLIFALVIPHIGFPGFQIIEFSLLNRTFVIPFLLGAIVLYLKKKYAWSFLLLGLMFDLHLVYTVFVIAMLVVDMALRRKEMEWKKILPALILFFLAILPLLIRKDSIDPGLDFSLRPELRDMEALSTLYTVYYPFGKVIYVLATTLQGFACVAIILLTMRRFPNLGTDLIFKNFLWAIAGIILVGSVASYFLPVTFFIQLQLIRAGVFLLYFGYIYFAYLIAKTIETENLSRTESILLIIAYVTFLVPLASLLYWQFRKAGSQKTLTYRKIIVLLVIAVEIGAAAYFDYLAPGYHIYGSKTAWVETQKWAKENTPQDAMFITPPDQYWHYVPDWRVFSERGTIATIPEFEVLHLNPEYMPGFVERFEDVAPGAIQKFNGDFRITVEVTREAFASLSDRDFIRIGEKYHAQYLVLPLSHKVSFTPIYTNSEFAIYYLP